MTTVSAAAFISSLYRMYNVFLIAAVHMDQTAATTEALMPSLLNSVLQRPMASQQQVEPLLRDREAELCSVIENDNGAYIGLSPDGIMGVWNGQSETASGWAAAETIGWPLDELIIPA